MDEQTRALYQQLLGELYRRMEHDPEIRRVLRRIGEGKATFRDTAVWSDRSAELLGEVFSEAIADMPAEARESICKALLRERYDSTNDICGEVQEALDAAQGLSLKPVKPKFPAERVQQIAHSLLDPTVEASVIERRAGAPVATVSKSFHDDYIRENASARTDLGFKCYLDRIAAPGCCKWCTGVAGRYVYGNHPDDIFHRHDNCSCTVTFENGRERQDVWSKKTWDAHDPKEIERLASRETVYTEEQAREIEENAVSGLTKPGQGDILRTRMAADSDFTLQGKVYSVIEDAAAVKAAEQYAKDILSAGVVDFSALKNGEVIQPLLERLGTLKEKHSKHFFQIIVDATMDDSDFAEVAPDLSLHLNANYMNSSEATADWLDRMREGHLLPKGFETAEYAITHEYMHFISIDELNNPRSKIHKLLPSISKRNSVLPSFNSRKNDYEFVADAMALVEMGNTDVSAWTKIYRFFFGGI
ncbi:MAG: hypothetical protein K5695_06290 [Oscillospiraceae bacterium]|nr:hypothetical protein [Oscillospiraceae bacterium]